MAQGRQLTLDVVRGTAILLVLIFHFRMPLGVPVFDAIAQPVFSVGWIGVDLFFVLSGFLVGRIILSGALTSAGLDRRRFFVRRIFRLWPTLFVYLAVMVLTGGMDAWRMVWPVLLHVQNYATYVPSHLWSLAVEEHFYLVAALLIPPILRRHGHVRVDQLLVMVMIACLCLRLAALVAGESLLHLQWQTQYRLDALAFGVLMASTAMHRPALFQRIANSRHVCMAIALAGAAILSVAGDGAFRHGIGFTIAYLSSGAFIMALIDCRIAPGLAWPVDRIAAIGLIAYPLYIWHAGVGIIIRSLAPSAWIAPPLLIIGVSVAVSIAVATAMHAMVERPIMRWRDGFSAGARPVEESTSLVM